MESKSRATAAGIFVMAMIVMLVITVLWFSRDRTVTEQYEIVTDRSVEGINSQANVELYGVRVGKVNSVNFVGGGAGQVRITMQIAQGTPINQATFATIASRGVTGAVYIDLADDISVSPEQRKLLSEVTPDGTVMNIPLRLGKLQSFTEGATAFFSKAETVLDNVNSLLSVDNQTTVVSTIKSFGDAADEIKELSASLNSGITKLTSGVNNVVAEANTTLKKIGSLSERAGRLVDDLGDPDGALQNLNRGTEQLVQAAGHLRMVTLPQVDQASQSLNRTLKDAQRFVQELENQPQMLIFGADEGEPGPGQKGYRAPFAASAE